MKAHESKPLDQRVNECTTIVSQLRHLGVYEECKAALAQPMGDFVRHATSSSGKLKVPSLERTLEYQFSNRSESFVALKH